MIFNWTTSKVVVSRIFRNTKGIDSSYSDDLPEWVAEAVRKLKTKYSLQVQHKMVDIDFFQGKIDFPGESLICVEHHGYKLRYNNSDGKEYPGNCNDDFISNLFLSVNPIYTAAGDLNDDTVPRSVFPRDIIVSLNNLGWHPELWYKLNYNKLQTNLRFENPLQYPNQCPQLKVWYLGLPVDPDDNNFPMIPDVEEYLEAVYWYCRMKLIEAGYEDKVFNHGMAKTSWHEESGRAINAISYPTPDQVQASIERHCQLMFPSEWYRATFNEPRRDNLDIYGGTW